MATLRSLLFITLSSFTLSNIVLASTIEKKLTYAIKRADFDQVQRLIDSPEAGIIKVADLSSLVEKADTAIAERSFLYRTSGEKWCIASSTMGVLHSLSSWYQLYSLFKQAQTEKAQEGAIEQKETNIDEASQRLLAFGSTLFSCGAGLYSANAWWGNWRAPRVRYNNAFKIKELLLSKLDKRQKQAIV